MMDERTVVNLDYLLTLTKKAVMLDMLFAMLKKKENGTYIDFADTIEFMAESFNKNNEEIKEENE